MKECVSKWLNEQFGGDTDVIGMVYEEYKSTMGRLIVDLADARSKKDAQTVDRVLHTIKGSAAMVGDMEVSNLAANARKQGSGADLDVVEQNLRDFVEAL